MNGVINRRLCFCAGHRVMGHENKCANLHGHNYVVTVTVAGKLDKVGRVIDFGAVKAICGKWLEENWDHAFLFYANDADVKVIFMRHPEWRHFECSFNPTAENMATFLLERFGDYFKGTGLELRQVLVEETENCSAMAAV
jgi:6-pyruvoyltetrahydropterin/6-carboxytetrahydropterin synthase